MTLSLTLTDRLLTSKKTPKKKKPQTPSDLWNEHHIHYQIISFKVLYSVCSPKTHPYCLVVFFSMAYKVTVFQNFYQQIKKFHSMIKLLTFTFVEVVILFNHIHNFSAKFFSENTSTQHLYKVFKIAFWQQVHPPQQFIQSKKKLKTCNSS